MYSNLSEQDNSSINNLFHAINDGNLRAFLDLVKKDYFQTKFDFSQVFKIKLTDSKLSAVQTTLLHTALENAHKK